MTLRPQIILNKKVLTSLIAPAGARNAAMIGTAIWGPMNTITSVSTLSEFVSYFGDDKTGTGVTGIKGADLFFRNGGTLKFVRIGDATEDYAVSTIKTPGGASAINLKGKYKGSYGNNIWYEVTNNPINASNRDIVVSDGVTTELINNSGVGYATDELMTAGINANSNLITAIYVNSGDQAVATAKTFLLLGTDGESSITSTIINTAFDDVVSPEEFNFLLIPGLTKDADVNTISGKLDTRASTEKLYSRYITGIGIDETIASANARTSVGSRLTIVAPNVKYTHRIDGDTYVLDGTYLACAYAGKLCSLDLEISGTHENVSIEGTSVLESSGKEYYTKAEQEMLLSGSIAPITKIGSSLQMVRGITRISDQTSVFFEEVVMDITDYISQSLELYLNSKLGKPNTTVNRSIYASELNARLTNFQSQGIIDAYTEATVVEGASPDTIIASVGIKPAYSTNFIELTLNIN